MFIKFLVSVCLFVFYGTDRILAMEKSINEPAHSNTSPSLSLETLVATVLKKAKKIKTENPHFNNRDLIKEFFIKNSSYQAPIETSESSFIHIKPKEIAILGAGPSGLIAALTLARDGHNVTLYEKRSKEEFSLRWQNISLNVPHLIKKEFPELNKILESQHLIHYEMELEDATKLRSYRIAIGDFQEALVSLCQKLKVDIHYEESPQINELSNAQIIIIATGAHNLDIADNDNLIEQFHSKKFPEYTTYGVAALFYEPKTNFAEGLTKERIFQNNKNIRWGFKVTFVGNGLPSQALRLAKINPSDPKFTSASKNPALHWYLFATKESHPATLPFQDHVDVCSYIDFVPSFALKGAHCHKGTPILLWEDARTTAHPLTGSGLTIPFRSAKALSTFVRDFDEDSSSLDRYNEQTFPLAQELFIKTLLVTLF